MIDISKVEKLMALMSVHGVDSVQVESGEEKISLARHTEKTLVQYVQPKEAHEAAEEKPAPLKSAAEEKKELPKGETITSPFVGTFYRSPNPELPSFVEVGSKVKKGQSLCIVEAMKLMNEIEAEIEGEIVAILMENAKPVEFGTPLFIISPVK